MAVAGGEVGEGHLVLAAPLGFHLMDRSRESVRRKPFAPGGCIEEGAIEPIRRGADDAMKADSIGGHDQSLCIGTGARNSIVIQAGQGGIPSTSGCPDSLAAPAIW